MEELIRSQIHHALSIDPPAGLRARVIARVPMDRSAKRQLRLPSFQRPGRWLAGFAAILLTAALIAGLLYSRSLLAPQPSPGKTHGAPNARVFAPDGLAIAPDGSVYFADFGSGWVFRIQADGSLLAFAGTSEPASSSEGSAGDGGPALGAYLFAPAGMTFDQNGNLFIADVGGNRIREIDSHGTVSTVAGSGPAILGVGTFTGDGGPATRARLFGPLGVAVDRDGNLYVTDNGNGRVRRIDIQGVIWSIDLSPWSGSSTATPRGIAVDSARNLYVSLGSRAGGCRIIRTTPQNTVSVIAGTGTCGYGGDGGPATAADLDAPSGIALDSSGNVYFADLNNHRIRRVDTNGIISTIADVGEMFPFDVALGPGRILYIAEGTCWCSGPTNSGQVQALSLSDGTLRTVVTHQTRIVTPAAQ